MHALQLHSLCRLLKPEDQQQVLEYERVRRSVDLQIIRENQEKLSGGRSTAEHHHTEGALDLTSAAAVKSKHLVQLLEGRPHQAKGGAAEAAKLAARAVSQHKLYRLVQAAASLAACCVYLAETYSYNSSSSRAPSAAVAVEAAVLACFLLAAAVELLAAKHRAGHCFSLYRLADVAAIAASAVFLRYNSSSSSSSKNRALLLGFAHAPRLALRLLALHDGLGATAIATSPLARRHSLHHRCEYTLHHHDCEPLTSSSLLPAACLDT
jgi:hypothetical protein